MELKEGLVVKSIAGHDGGSFYVVLKLENGFAFIADGKERKVEKPKKKNIKHLARTNSSLELSALTNKKLKFALKKFNMEQNIAEESD